MILLIKNKLLVIVQGGVDTFIKDLNNEWSKGERVTKKNLPQVTKKDLIPFSLRNFFGIAQLLRSSISIIRYLNRKDYKILFIEWGSYIFAIITYILKLIKINKPVLVRMHRYEIFEPLLYRIDFSNVTKIILVSEYTKDELLKRLPHLEDKIVVIPNGIEEKGFYPAPNKKITFKIGILGRLSSEKRLDLLIEIMKKIDDKRIKIHVGGDGDMKTTLIKKINDNGLSNRIILDGYISKVREWFNDKDLIINNSDVESFGVALIEGMACGVIPLMRGWDAAKYVFPEEFILPYDENAFVNEMVKKILDFYQLEEMVVKQKRDFVRKYVVERYTLKIQLERFDSLFKSLI